VFRISREKLDSEVRGLDIMSCRKQREQMDGEGGCGGKDGRTETEEEEEDIAEEDEEECSDEEETDGSRTTYKKNRWRVVAVWTHYEAGSVYGGSTNYNGRFQYRGWSDAYMGGTNG